MKKFYSILATVLITVTTWAQSPQKMSYQAVIRNAGDLLVTTTQVGMQISILQGTETGTAVYVETQTPTTNENGLITIKIGEGVQESIGYFVDIDWSAGPYFIKTEIDPDPAGGLTDYSITGTSEVLSVPYALHSKTAASYPETDPVFVASPANGITGANISNWTSAYGWGNHASAGYLTSFTETDPVFVAHAANGITPALIGNWNTAYGWGDHSTKGYFANGGETGGGDRTLGNEDSFSLGFKTNDETRLFLSNDGKIGIGTATPNGYLEVTDKGDNTPYNLIVLGQTATPNRLRLSSGTNYGIISVGPSIDESKGLTIRHSSGYIGMGTSDPSTKLDVNGVITATGGNSTNWNTAFSWGAHSLAGYFANGGETKGINRTLGNTDNFSLGLKTGNVTRLHISPEGNIGIGTIAPIIMLQIVETDDPYNGYDDDGDGLIDEPALDVTGRVKIADGTQGEGKVLTSNADGLAAWATSYTHPAGDGNLHVPPTGTTNNGKVLTAGATAGSLSWVTPTGGGGSTHYLGEEYNDGIIFYIYKGSDGSEHGLIVSKTEGTSLTWNGSTLVGADRTEDGAYNMDLMPTGAGTARSWVEALGPGWYLPSADELSLLWHSRYHVNKTARAISSTLLSSTAFYWSSTEVFPSFAVGFDFSFLGGGMGYDLKTSTYSVRAVRAF